MKDGIINIGTKDADSLGFTEDKFTMDSYLWKDKDCIYISFIASVSPGKGDFRRLVAKIHSLGLTVKIPTPLSRMDEICRKNGYQHIFAVCHVPPGYPYSGKIDASQVRGIDANRELAPVLSAGGVEELFCGHFHAYLQDKEDGLLITITGGAGAPLMGNSPHHYVLVEINGKHRTQQRVEL